MVPEAHLRYVPNAVDVTAINPVNGTRPHRAVLLMVADFHYAPNRVGREWLVEDILPRVWREVPDAHLMLVGRGSQEWPPPDTRIETTGFVDDLDTIYEQAACVVVPVTTGGGTPLKFVEALAYQVPIVATGFAARGLDAVAGKHYLQGDDADSFARAIVGVLREHGAGGLAAAG
jgi:glycosyltransferase involved in cell wall biosynthesis